MIAASTPMVPLATIPQAAHSPGSERSSPRTWTCGSGPANGISAANSRNGTSTTIRGRTTRGGSVATAARHGEQRRVEPKAQNSSSGVATTMKTNTTRATILTSGGQQVDGRVAVEVQLLADVVAVPVLDRRGDRHQPPTLVSTVSCRRRRASQVNRPNAIAATSATPMIAGQPAGQPARRRPRSPA